MPQPLPEGNTLHYRPKIILERPNHAIGIALVVAEWAALEEMIFSEFSFALFAFDMVERHSHLVAKEAWNEMTNLPQRLGFIESVAQRKIPQNLFDELENKVHPEIRKRAKERNRVVHGHWHLCSNYPEDLILNSEGEEKMRYTVKDFHDISQRINDTLNMTASFWLGRVHPRLKSLNNIQ